VKAVIRTEYGSADVMRLVDVDRPVPGAREVIVKVDAAGFDIGVWHVATGLPLLARLAFGLSAPRLPGLGSELAGVVDAVGAEVTGFSPGDEVFGVGNAAFAEYSVVAETKLAPKPASVPSAAAAASAISGVTALQAMRAAGRLGTEHRVLVLGASGGVGSFVVQLAHATGAHVTGAASTAKLDFVRGLGADEAVDYTAGDPTDGSQLYDVIIDMGGNRPRRALRRALTPAGRAVIVGGEGGGRFLGGFQRAMTAGLASALRRQKVSGLVSITKAADLVELAGLLESRVLVPAVDRIYPLAEAPDAMQRLESRRVRGKLVIDPRQLAEK
jgi:NADPH:quinone reductase-like Zn-dependent oxidoreductase